MWKDLPYTAEIDIPIEYFYFARQWWNGPNVDASVWWRDASGGCHFKSVVTGEGISPLPAVVVADREISHAEFSAVLEDCVAAGIYHIEDDRKSVVRGMHFSTTVAIKRCGRPEHSYFIAAGAKNLEHAKIVRIVDKYDPDLFEGKRVDLFTLARREIDGGESRS